MCACTPVPSVQAGVRALLTRRLSVDLSHNPLSSIRCLVTRYNCLVRLCVAGTGLTTLPTLLYTLPHLRHLDVSRCKLTRLASSVAQLASLQSLDLHGNALTTLPFGLCRLTSLVLLDCTENPLPPPLAAAAGARVGWLEERPLHPLPLLTLLAVGACVRV
jgi:hypothetical protein